jgi:hypothetical protein
MLVFMGKFKDIAISYKAYRIATSDTGGMAESGLL